MRMHGVAPKPLTNACAIFTLMSISNVLFLTPYRYNRAISRNLTSYESWLNRLATRVRHRLRWLLAASLSQGVLM